MDRLYTTQAHTEVDASGEAVGLPPGMMGNSEVGHLTIGAGRVIYQDVMRITKAIESGAFSRNPATAQRDAQDCRNGHTLHIWGLLSDGSVHSHIDHLMALLDLAAETRRAAEIAVHAVLDGRDKPPRSALAVHRPARSEAEANSDAAASRPSPDATMRWIATSDGSGSSAHGATSSRARRLVAPSARAAVEKSYAADKSDEFVEPHVDRQAEPMVSDGDQVICLQLPRRSRARTDRPRSRCRIIQRLRPPAPSESRLRVHDRIRSRIRTCRWRSGPRKCSNTLAEVFARARIRNICASPRPRNMRTSPIFSTAASSSRFRSKSAR